MAKNKKNTAAAKTASNKTAPKPPAQLRAVPKEKDEEIELDSDSDDEDEELDEDGVAVGSDAKSHKARYVGRVNRMQPRINNLMAFAAQTPRLHAAAAAIMTALKGLAAEAEKLPEDWKRARIQRPGKAFNPGDIVSIADGHKAKYKGLIEDDELDGLRVVKQIDKRVSVKTESGDKMFVPASHLAKPTATN